MRRHMAWVIVALALAACDGADGVPTPSPVTGGPSPTSTPAPSATPSPTGTTASPATTPAPLALDLPDDAPTRVEGLGAVDSIGVEDLGRFLPPGGDIGFSHTTTDPFEQIALAWRRGDEPLAAEQGFVVWQRSEQAWEAVYAFTATPQEEVLGISVQTGELTGEGPDEYLTFEQTGGTGACGRWRVISLEPGVAQEVFDRTTCDTEVRLAGSALVMREAVYGPNDPHCCPRAFRTSTFEWDGQALALTSTQREPAGP